MKNCRTKNSSALFHERPYVCVRVRACICECMHVACVFYPTCPSNGNRDLDDTTGPWMYAYLLRRKCVQGVASLSFSRSRFTKRNSRKCAQVLLFRLAGIGTCRRISRMYSYHIRYKNFFLTLTSVPQPFISRLETNTKHYYRTSKFVLNQDLTKVFRNQRYLVRSE